jgi:Arginase family
LARRIVASPVFSLADTYRSSQPLNLISPFNMSHTFSECNDSQEHEHELNHATRLWSLVCPATHRMFIMFGILQLLAFGSDFVQRPHQAPLDTTLSDTKPETWLSKYGQPWDLPYSGFLTFSHIPHTVCLADQDIAIDIAVLGFPFDSAVSYRPGARFGPYAIRSGSRRQRDIRGYTLSWGLNPYDQGTDVIDCGDVRFLPY